MFPFMTVWIVGGVLFGLALWWRKRSKKEKLRVEAAKKAMSKRGAYKL